MLRRGSLIKLQGALLDGISCVEVGHNATIRREQDAISRFPLKSCESVQNHFAQTATAGSHHMTLAPRTIIIRGQNRKRTILSRARFAVAGMAVMFAAHPTQAQPLASPLSPEIPISGTPQPVVHQATDYCKSSTLSSATFLNLIHTIVAHGDLTDVAFIEKTLGAKFNFDQDWSWDRTAVPNVLHLRSDEVLGSPITATLAISKIKSQQLNGGYIAAISMHGPPNFISDCFHIPIHYFSSAFDDNFVFRPTGEGVPSGMYTQLKGVFGKNGSQMIVSFSFEFKDNIVDSVAITQEP
jgi:hypothetical protein